MSGRRQESTSTVIGRRLIGSIGRETPPGSDLPSRDPRSRSPGKLEQRIPRRARRPLAVRAASAPIGEERHCHPGGMEDEAGEEHELSRHRADRRPLPDVTERRDRDGVDEQLADVARYLDQEDPAVVPPQPAPRRLEEGDVEVRGLIVMVENLVPAVVDPRTLPAEDRSEEVDFQDMRPDAPEIEETVASGLDAKKDGDEKADQDERKG